MEQVGETFLHRYIKYNEGNECPVKFHLWGGLAVLSVAAGRRFYFDLDYFRIYPNLYVCLVGPQGSRKTVARDIAMDTLRNAIPDVVVSASCETRQGIVKFMSEPEQVRTFKNANNEVIEYRPYAAFISELMNFVSIDPIGMVNFLTDIYDREVYDYRIKNEQYFLERPYFVLFACTTPEWLVQSLKSSVICGGFSRRVIYVVGDEDKRIPFPFVTPEMAKSMQVCVDWLKLLQHKSGEFKMDDQAKKFYADWYVNVKLPTDPFLRGWVRSKHIQLIKICMLAVLAENLDNYIIEERHLRWGVEVLKEVEAGLPTIVQHLGRSEVVFAVESITNYLKDHDNLIPEKVLRAAVFKDFKTPLEYAQTLEHLINTDQIAIIPVEENGVVRRYVIAREHPKFPQKS